jgi:uncharacterized membrane protein
MARIEESVEINRPADKVFTYTTEAKKWPEWQSFIMEAEQTSQESMGVGTTFRGVVRLMGLSMKWTAATTEYEPNKHWAKNIKSGGMSIVESVSYDVTEKGTKFTIAYDVKAGGIFKLFSPMIVSTMRKETKKSLGDLKKILESQT